MKSVYEPLTWLVGGEAGYGITTMGETFARVCSRAGLHVHGYGEYPSLIRGGHNTAMVRVSPERVLAHSDKIDLLMVLNRETLDFHLNEMAEGGAVIYDGESVVWDYAKDEEAVSRKLRIVSVPLARLTKELEADRVMRNTVALGASFGILDFDFSYVEQILADTFARKGKEVVDYNIKVARAGYNYVKENFKDGFPVTDGGKKVFGKKVASMKAAPKRIVISGNEAIALAAIKAGVKFMAAYPMTPVTSIMQIIASHGVKYGIVMKHTEDEIAAMNMAIGAAHMGVRAMTVTSGGGFSLMTEALGMAGITETPLVVIEGTRPGPSTGLPTWTDQSDLRFIMHASQGEFPRVVMLPGDVDESFTMTLKAFNLAEKYQMICLINTDKYLAESIQSTAPFKHEDYRVDRGELLSLEEAVKLKEGDYKRFEFTESGVSKRAVPGMPNCIYSVSTDEHKEDGDLDESGENRRKMMDKRARKMVTLQKESLKEDEMMELHGPTEADLTVVGWGSTKGPLLEAVHVANENGLKVNFLQIKYALPFPSEGVSRVLENAKKTLMVENNSEAQMAGVIREHTGIRIDERLLRYDGRPLHPAEILDKIKTFLSS